MLPGLNLLRPTALPAVIFLLLLPLWPLVQRRHARLFLSTLSVVAIIIVAGPALAAGLMAAIVAAYWPIEWAARRRGHRRLVLLGGLALAHAAYWASFHLPLPYPYHLLRAADAPTVFVLFSGIGLTFFRLVSHFYDRMRGRTGPTSFADYLAYMLYFPQFRHGPIERSRRLVPSLRGARSKWRPRDVAIGLARIGFGVATLALPALIDQTGLLDALHADSTVDVFSSPEQLSLLPLLAVVHAIPLILYALESGFASVQLGVSRAFGIRGTENFRNLWLARSPQDIWQRWNVTVGTWLRDYFYAPLGGGKRHRYLNIVLVFLYCGLLHGWQRRTVVWALWTGGTLAAFAWLRDHYRTRRAERRFAGAIGDGGVALPARSLREREASEPARSLFVFTGRAVTRVVLAVALFEWCAVSATIIADPEHCGVRLLGEMYARLGRSLFAMFGMA